LLAHRHGGQLEGVRIELQPLCCRGLVHVLQRRRAGHEVELLADFGRNEWHGWLGGVGKLLEVLNRFHSQLAGA